jgi:DNA-directed RNA polymerase specialized sigma subunit
VRHVDTTVWNFATDGLITEHFTLARRMAWWAYRRFPALDSVDINDVESDAMLGLVMAGRRYDPDRGEFKKFALTEIRSAIYLGYRKAMHRDMKEPPVFVPLADWGEEA